MTTTCLDCMVSTGVGEMWGTIGLPSLDEAPRGRGRHRLAKTLTTGGDADTDETFGFIYSGFRGLGLRIYSLERYRAFLEEHSLHRLFEWADEEDEDALPRELRGNPPGRLVKFKPPARAEGYVHSNIMFECSKCGDSFASQQADWVKPIEPAELTSGQIREFHRRVGGPSECCIHEADPFGILYTDLDSWLAEHRSHKPVMRLVSSEGSLKRSAASRDSASVAAATAAAFTQACSERLPSEVASILDYSPQSLSGVDAIISWLAEGRVGENDKEDTHLLFAAGCYVGEVIVRALGGEWCLTAPTNPAPSVRLVNGEVCEPVRQVYRLYQGKKESVVRFFARIATPLGGGPDEPGAREPSSGRTAKGDRKVGAGRAKSSR